MDEAHNLITIYQRGWLMAAIDTASEGAEPAVVIDALLDNSMQTASAIIEESWEAGRLFDDPYRTSYFFKETANGE